MVAAMAAVHAGHPRRVIAAVPVAPPEVCEALGDLADEVICLVTPERLGAVCAWYEDFSDTPDAELCELLATAAPA